MSDRSYRTPKSRLPETTVHWNQPSVGGLGLMPYTGPIRSAPPLWVPVGTVLPRWSMFLSFGVAGAMLGFGVLGLLSVGAVLAPFGVAAVVLLAVNRRAGPSWPGAIAGLGLSVLWMAWLNRHGPGWVCDGTGSCVDEDSPWMFFGVGAVLIVAGFGAFLLVRERAVGRQLEDPEFGWRPSGW